MASSTGQAIREELQRYGLLRMLGQATATGTTARLRDATRLLSTTLPSTAFNGCYVRITALGGVADGEQVLVDYLDPDLGDLYVSPAWSVAPTSAATYEIWRAGIDPDDVDRLRDEALTSICSQWQPLPLSIVSNAAYYTDLTSWTATDAAQARQTVAFPTELWPASILVTNSAGNGRSASASIFAIRASDYFYLYVPVSVRSGTAEIVVRDITNGANISLSGGSTTETRRGWSAFEVTGQVPATCDEIQVWLRGTEATAIVEWGPVFFYPQNARRIALEARVDTIEKVGPVYRMTRYPTATGGGSFAEEDREEVPDVRKIQVNDAVYFQFSAEPIRDAPYFYEERVYYTALSSAYFTAANRATGDAATTLCPLDYVTAATAKLIAEMMLFKAPHEADFYAGVVGLANSRLRNYERLYGPEPKPSLTLEREISIPYLRV